jgi:hypothetical protein
MIAEEYPTSQIWSGSFDTRFARRAARESDGFNWLHPRGSPRGLGQPRANFRDTFSVVRKSRYGAEEVEAVQQRSPTELWADGAASRTLRFRVNFRSLVDELFRFGCQAFFQGFFFGDALLGGVFADVLGDFHGAEMRAAHRAKMRGLGAVLREGFVMKFARGHGAGAARTRFGKNLNDLSQQYQSNVPWTFDEKQSPRAQKIVSRELNDTARAITSAW